jgi:hypothetical protein
MKSRNNSVLFSENLILLGLFVLAGMNFKAKFFYFVFAALLVHIVMHRRIRIDRSIIWYVFFTIVYAAYALRIGWMDTIRKFAFVGCYILGFNTMLLASEKGGARHEEQGKWLEACIASVSIGSWLHLMLNYIINQGSSGTRNTIDIWTRQTMAATGQAALAVLMLATGIVWFLLPRVKSMRWIGIGAVLAILLYNLMLGGRTLIVLTGLLLLVATVYVFVNRQCSAYQKRNAAKLLIILILCIAVVFTFNVAEVRSKLLESNLLERFENAENADELLEDGRMDNKIKYLKSMLKYPFGGSHMRDQYGFAHDLLLDAYDECGMMMLISLIGILISAFADALSVLKRNSLAPRTKCLIICIYIAILVEFCMEPIFAGMPWMFACFALISGCIRGVVCTNE